MELQPSTVAVGKQRTDLPKPGEILHLDFRTKDVAEVTVGAGGDADPTAQIKLLQVRPRQLRHYLTCHLQAL